MIEKGGEKPPEDRFPDPLDDSMDSDAKADTIPVSPTDPVAEILGDTSNLVDLRFYFNQQSAVITPSGSMSIIRGLIVDQTIGALENLHTTPLRRTLHLQKALRDFRVQFVIDLRRVIIQAERVREDYAAFLKEPFVAKIIASPQRNTIKTQIDDPLELGNLVSIYTQQYEHEVRARFSEISKRWVGVVIELLKARVRWFGMLEYAEKTILKYEQSSPQSERLRKMHNACKVYRAAMVSVRNISGESMGDIPSNATIQMLKRYLEVNKKTPALNE